MNNCNNCFMYIENIEQYTFCPYCFQSLQNKNSVENLKPSLIQKAQNLATSVVNHISNGMVKVSDPIKEERMAICRACPFFNSSNTTCNKCGCFLEVKTGWASEKCPEGKWDEVKTQSSGGCGCNKS